MLPRNIKTFSATFLLAALMVLQIAAPFSTYAQLPPVKTGTNKLENFWDTITSTDWLVKNVAEPILVRVPIRAAIVAITQQVVNWISADGGNKVGFIGNFEQALTNELDDRAGEFLGQLSVIDFCGDIGAYLRLNLRMPAGGLRQRAKCSLSAVVSNVQNFYDNFQNGGWEAFLKTSVDIQNNTAGAFLLTLDAKLASESRKNQAFLERYKKSGPIMGKGIKTGSKTNCVPQPEQCDVDGNCFTPQPKCTTEDVIETPGEIITNALNKANTTGIDLGISAKFVDEAIVAPIISALLNRTIQSAHGIFGRSPNTTVSYNDPGLFKDYKEISPSRDSLRARSDAAMFTIQGALTTTTDQTLALRREMTSASPARKLELAQQTEDMLGKNRTLLTEHDIIANTKLSSYVTITPRDIEQVDDQVSQTLNRVEPIAAEVGSSPSASPTGDLKTDTLASINGSRTQLASQIALVRQAIQEVTAAIGGLSTTSIVANQSLFITQANQLSTRVSALAGDISAEQSRVSALRQKLLSPDAAQLIDQLKPKQDKIMSAAEKIGGELNGFADSLARDQEQIGALKAKLVNRSDGALIDNIVVQAASIIAEVRQLAAEIGRLAADISTEQTQTNALQEKLQRPEAVRLVNRLNLAQANIVAEGDKINAEISTLTDTIAEAQARVGVLRQQLVGAQAGQIISEITTLTDAIANQQARIGVLRQQLVNEESGQLISQISDLTDTIANEQARVSVPRQQLKSGGSAEINGQIAALLADIKTQQTQIGTLRRQLLAIGGTVNTQIANLLADILIKQSRISTLREQLLAIGGTVNTEVAQLLSDILLKQARIRMLREDLITIRDLGRFATDIAANQSRIIPIPDQIRAKISKIIVDLKAKQIDIKNLMQRLLTLPTTVPEAQLEAKLENYMELLTSPNGSERGALEALQEADTRLRASGDRLARVATAAEVTAEVGSSIDAIKNASDTQQRASQTMQAVFGFLDNLNNPDFTPQPAL